MHAQAFKLADCKSRARPASDFAATIIASIQAELLLYHST